MMVKLNCGSNSQQGIIIISMINLYESYLQDYRAVFLIGIKFLFTNFGDFQQRIEKFKSLGCFSHIVTLVANLLPILTSSNKAYEDGYLGAFSFSLCLCLSLFDSIQGIIEARKNVLQFLAHMIRSFLGKNIDFIVFCLIKIGKHRKV